MKTNTIPLGMSSMMMSLFLIVVSSPIYGQFNQLSGKVIDAHTDSIVVGAHIQLLNSEKGTYSQEDGTFELNEVTFPTKILISHLGYEIFEMDIKSETLDFMISMVPLPKNLNEVVITAFEKSRNIINTPSAISYFSKDEIERFGLVNYHKSLSVLPGIKVESTTPGRSAVAIRGGALGDVAHGQEHKFYWDGIPVTYSSGNTPIDQFDFGSMKNISVIKGPSGSIYGAGLGGVMLIENRKPSLRETSFQADFQQGSFGTSRLSGTFAQSGDHSNLRVQASTLKSDGYREEAYADHKFINAFAQIFPNEKHKIAIIGQYLDRSYGIPGNISLEQVQENRRQSSFLPSLDNALNGVNLLLGISSQMHFNSKWENTTAVSFQNYEGDFFIGSAFFKVADKGFKTAFTLRNATAYNFDLAQIGHARLVFGGELTMGSNHVDDFTDGFQSPIFSSRFTRDNVLLLFSQLEMNLPLGFQTTLGMSYNRFKLEFEERLNTVNTPSFSKHVEDVSPRIALIKNVNEKMLFYGNLSKGFSPPPRGAIDNYGAFINFNLESTKGWNKELGLRGNFIANRLSYDMSLYQQDETDVIVPKIIEAGEGVFVAVNENAGRVQRQGIELWSAFNLVKTHKSQLLKEGKLWGSYTYMHHKFIDYNSIEFVEGIEQEVSFDQNKIPGISPHTVVLGLDLMTLNQIYMNSTFSYFDEVYLNNANTDTTEGYSTLDFKLGYRTTFWDRLQLNIFGGINNVLNTEYNAILTYNAFFGNYYDPAPKRNYFIGTSIKYMLNE